jgi:aspartate racemase
MKKLGLIGGVGPESTIEYYRLIIKEYQNRTQTKEYPEMVIHSINMTEMLNYVFEKRYDDLVRFMVERIAVLEKAGVDLVAIASNTPHIVFDEIAERVNIHIISIVETACNYINNKNMRKVGLLGTKSTMTAGFYAKVAAKYHIQVIVPTPDEQDFIHGKYMSELIFNTIKPETKNRLVQIVGELKEKEGIEGLILGGTELPLILSQDDFNDIEVFDTTIIHVQGIVKQMIE